MKRITEAFRGASTHFIEQGAAALPPTLVPPATLDAPTRPLLNIYCTAGYPHLDSTMVLLRTLSDAGVDFIELGMPYSDPLADGETIQQSSTRALRNGITLAQIFEQVASVRAEVRPPIILMGYYNQVTRYGRDRFLNDCTRAGVDGLILPDLPLDIYREEFRDELERREIGISFLVTPRTPADRIREIDALCRGFLYVVSASSTTGNTAKVQESSEAYFERLSRMDLKSPRLIGFNLKDRAGLAATTRYAAGGIIGSAFIRALEEGDVAGSARRFVEGLR